MTGRFSGNVAKEPREKKKKKKELPVESEDPFGLFLKEVFKFSQL